MTRCSLQDSHLNQGSDCVAQAPLRLLDCSDSFAMERSEQQVCD